MVAKAIARFVRVSPFKVRQALPFVRGKNAQEALMVLSMLNPKGAFHLGKVLKSAIANAKNKGYNQDQLFVCKATADGGPMLKRFRAASFGRATSILKRTSHILVELDSREKLIRQTPVLKKEVVKQEAVKKAKPAVKKAKKAPAKG